MTTTDLREQGTHIKYGKGRNALIRAVVDVVAEQGLDALSYRKVAERAGVNNTLILHHFGTKEALLEAATSWVVEQSRSFADQILESAGKGGFAKAFTDMVAADPNLQLFQYYMTLAVHRSPELMRISAGLYGSYVNDVQHFLAHFGHNADRAAARTVAATLDGLVLQQLTVSSQAEVMSSIQTLLDVLDRG